MSKELKQQIIQWLNKNRHNLGQYRQQYIAYNQNGVLVNNANLSTLSEEAEKTGEVYSIYFVPKNNSCLRILPIQLRAVSRHGWEPNYYVTMKHRQREKKVTMLVDSGADCSVISLNLGHHLGFQLADGETVMSAAVMGGTVAYVLRNVELTIDEYKIVAPVAWLQQEGEIEPQILGREVVFDKFDIEFKQAEEIIIFKWRDN